METIVVTEGNSEQAKAIGILRAKGDILGFFCSDNYLIDRNFLSSMYWCASRQEVTGAYSAHYSHVARDKPLSRYFSLLGANDPLCWWLGKSDRFSYMDEPKFGLVNFRDSIPSIGDNGFFVKRTSLKKICINPDLHFPMDMCEDLRRAGEYTYFLSSSRIWHKSGERFLGYFRRRYVYTRDLYFRQREKRRWHMVESKDWPKVLGFSIVSLLVLPHLWISFRGFRKIRDWAWFLHPIVCLLITLIYTGCFLRWGLKRPSSSQALIDQRVFNAVSQVLENRPVRTLKPLS